jgi:conjugative transfer signal peptidase TraF
MRRLAMGCLVVFALGCLAVALGLRWNGSASYPVGLYLASHKEAHRGDLVLVSVPDLPVFAMARDRGYLNVAYSPSPRLLKRLVGVAGDRVTIDSYGVQVNGIRVANSAPLKVDGAGRSLEAFAVKDHFLGRVRGPADVGIQP